MKNGHSKSPNGDYYEPKVYQKKSPQSDDFTNMKISLFPLTKTSTSSITTPLPFSTEILNFPTSLNQDIRHPPHHAPHHVYTT